MNVVLLLLHFVDNYWRRQGRGWSRGPTDGAATNVDLLLNAWGSDRPTSLDPVGDSPSGEVPSGGVGTMFVVLELIVRLFAAVVIAGSVGCRRRSSRLDARRAATRRRVWLLAGRDGNGFADPRRSGSVASLREWCKWHR